MCKISTSNCDETETVFFQLYYVGYITEDYKVPLPSYLLNFPFQNDAILEIDDQEELNDRENGGYSYEDGDYAQFFDNTMRQFDFKRMNILLGVDSIDDSIEGWMNYALLHVGDTMDPNEVKIYK